MPCPCSQMQSSKKKQAAATSQQQQHAIKSDHRSRQETVGRGVGYTALRIYVLCRTVWGTKIGTTGETPGSHVLEAAEDGQCDGRGGGFADGVGERKIKKRAAGPTQGHPRPPKGGQEKRRTRTWASLHQGAASHGTWGHSAGSSGTVQVVQCHTYRPYSHQGQLRHLKKYDKVAGLQLSCSAKRERGEGGEKQNPPNCHPSKPVRASRVTTAQATPRLGSYRSTRSALGTALFANTCRTSTR